MNKLKPTKKNKSLFSLKFNSLKYLLKKINIYYIFFVFFKWSENYILFCSYSKWLKFCNKRT